LGGHAVMLGKHYGHQGVVAFGDYIQQGPKGASVLCFICGVTTSVVGVMYVGGFFTAITDPLHFVLYVYILAFGLSTTCLEADPDRIGMSPWPFDGLAAPLTRGQAWLHSEVRILTELRGRGALYLFSGSLMATQCVFCLLFLVGVANAVMGALCLGMSFGITPDFDRLAAGEGMQWSAVEPEEGSAEMAAAASGAVSGMSGQLERLVPAAPPVSSWMSTTANVGRSIDAEFRSAAQAYSNLGDKLPGKACRALWALQNQATVGDCNEPKPSGMINGNAKEQWRLWNELKGIACEDAKVMFVERLRKEKIGM